MITVIAGPANSGKTRAALDFVQKSESLHLRFHHDSDYKVGTRDHHECPKR